MLVIIHNKQEQKSCIRPVSFIELFEISSNLHELGIVSAQHALSAQHAMSAQNALSGQNAPSAKKDLSAQKALSTKMF